MRASQEQCPRNNHRTDQEHECLSHSVYFLCRILVTVGTNSLAQELFQLMGARCPVHSVQRSRPPAAAYSPLGFAAAASRALAFSSHWRAAATMCSESSASPSSRAFDASANIRVALSRSSTTGSSDIVVQTSLCPWRHRYI